MSDQATMEDTRERISAMLQQEEKFYVCPNYMAADYLTEAAKPLHFVEECAMLVTDLGLDDESSFPSGSSRRPLSSRSHSFYRQSPSSVATHSFESSACSKSVTPDMDHSNLVPWRRQMCTWAYAAMDTFDLDREIVAVSFSILDRYLANEASFDARISKEDFQLFCMTAIYIAVKVLEPTRKLSIEALVDMSRGYYNEEDVTVTEIDMLQSLKWHINPPTAVAFVRAYLELVPDADKLLSTCCHFVEMAVADSYFVSQKASDVAKAAILMAVEEEKFGALKLCQLRKVADLCSKDVIEVYSHITHCE